MILATLYSFLLYRRGNKSTPLPFASQPAGAKIGLFIAMLASFGLMYYLRTPLWVAGIEAACIVAAVALTFGNRAVWGENLMFAMSTGLVGFYGFYGYVVEAIVRIGFSIHMVGSVFLVLIMATTIDVVAHRGAPEVGPIQWGKIPDRAQYVLFVLATSFTWLMGLMGYARSGLRTHWHVFNVVRDYSSDAFTPNLGYACWVVSIIVLLFMLLVSFIFWLAHLGSQGHAEDEALLHGVPVAEPAGAAD
jgi:hypothetical protein